MLRHSSSFVLAALRAVILISLTCLAGISRAASPCPPIGYDSECGVVITITDTGSSIRFTGQGSYDGDDDTLVGVINNSKVPISSIDLTSTNPIFGFDGDGIVAYGAPGNPRDPTGYGGPNAYFTNYSGGKGTVNFVVPIPPGGTAYFSLEDALGHAVACSDIINKSVPKPTGGSPTISATFTPQKVNGVQYTLKDAATLCGFVDFNWVQLITHEVDPNRLSASNLAVTATTGTVNGQTVPLHLGGKFRPAIAGPVKLTAKLVPLSDPPQGGGYTYNVAPDYSYPFYCDPLGDPVCARTSTTLSMQDTPTQTCMVDAAGNPSPAYTGSALVRAGCGNTTAKKGSIKKFTTHLAGMKKDGTAFDLGIGFSWTTNYNGTAGGITVSGKNGAAPDPDSGTGGVVVTSYSPTTNYAYGGISVSGVNGASLSQTLLDSSQVSVASSGLSFSRVSQLFNGSVTVTNVGTTTLTGPLQLVLDSLPGGVTVLNASHFFGGFPYLTLQEATLAPGQSAVVIVQFKNPSLVAIEFSPLVYTGALE